MMLLYSVSLFALVSIASALECHVNRTHTERCSTIFSTLLPIFCYNRTVETDDGRHHHSYGCADWKMRSMPIDNHRSAYCFFPNNKLWQGHGKVCFCTTNSCNYTPHRRNNRASWNSSPTIPIISLVSLASLAFI